MTTPDPLLQPVAGSATSGGLANTERPSYLGRYIGSTYASLLITVATGPIIARALGVEGRGEYAAAFTLSLVVGVVTCLGLQAALLHASGQPGANAQRQRLVGVCYQAGVIMVPVCVGLALLSVIVFQDYSSSGRNAVFLVVVATPLTVFTYTCSALLASAHRLRELTTLRVTGLVFPGLAAVGLAAAGLLTVFLAALTLVLSTVLTAVLCASYLGRPSFLSVRPFTTALAFGVRALPGQMGSLVNLRVDQFVLIALASTRELGTYAVAASIAVIPTVLSQALATDMTGRATAALDLDERHAVLAENFRRIALICGAMCLLIGAVAPVAVPLLYGSAFEEVADLLWLLLPGSFALCLTSTATPALVLLGRPAVTSVAEGIAVMVTVVGLVALVPNYGAAAAAIVSTVAYSLTAMLLVAVLRHAGIGALRPTSRDLTRLLTGVRRRLPLPRRLRDRRRHARH